MKSLTKHQKLVLIVAWLGWVFDVMEASLFALTKKPMLTEMLGAAKYAEIGPIWEGKIHTAMLLGWSLGGLIFGMIADRWGRSRTLLLTVFLYCLFTGLTAFCKTPEQVWVARFLTGLGIGGEWAAGAALIAETVPDHFRPKAAAFLQTAAAIGSICGVFINLSIGGLHWSYVYFAGITPAILCLAARWKLEGDEPKKSTSSTLPVVDLLKSKPYNFNLLIAVIIGVVGITGGGILPFWLPNFVPLVVAPEQEALYRNLSMIVLHLGTLAGVLVFPPLAAKYGRRPMFALFGICAAICLFFTATQVKSVTMLFILPPITSFFALGLTAGFGLYFPELFASRFRTTGAGIAYNSGRILSAPIPIWLGATVKEQGVQGTKVVALIYVLMLLGLLFAPETKDKPLEA
jgi:MFS family permease